MGYKLLLADDSITIQKVVGIIFANEDYELTVVDNGNATLEKAKEVLPDVILVDALMPGKSGYDVCREVRQDPALKDIPLLLLVGAFEPFDEEKARNSGADDHISKPFESQNLIEKVKKLIELGGERAKASVLCDTTADAPASVDNRNIRDELWPKMESGSAPSVAITGDKVVGEKAADVLYLDSLEIVEAAPEDDLWGAFEVEEIAEGEDVQPGEIIEEDEFQPEIIDPVEEIEPFVFKEEESTPFGNGNTISLREYPEDVSETENEADEGFIFKEDSECENFGGFAQAEPSVEIVEVTCLAPGEDVVEEKQEVSGFVHTPPTSLHGVDTAPSSVSPFLQTDQNLQFAPEEEYVPSSDILSCERDVQAAGVSETAGSDAINLSEEQLAGILSKVSREIIEKIAWEVVPDLAETIIREEIRKIKEGY